MEKTIETLMSGPKEKIFREIYDMYSKKMHNFCYLYLANRTDTLTVLHDGFLVVLEKIKKERFDGFPNLEKWIRQIMRNKVFEYMRNRDTNYSRTGDMPENDIESAERADSDTLVRDYETLIQCLPALQVKVFNMYAIEGYSHGEIAGMLRIGEQTSKNSLSAARKTMQKLIKNTQ